MSANEALIQICVGNDIEGLIDILEQNNYNINYQTNDYFQNTGLHHLCKNGNIEMVKILLQCDKIDINVQNFYGQTPLALCFIKHHIKIAKLLLKTQKCNLALGDRNEETAL